MKTILELVAQYLQPDTQARLERALETIRDCAKEAMTNARIVNDRDTSEMCRKAYQAVCHQLILLRKVISSTKEK